MIMMGGDRKKTLNQILGDDPRDEKQEGGESPPDALSECVSEFIDAVKADDVDAATQAFRSCFAELSSGPSEEG